MSISEHKFLERAIELSREGMQSGKGGPFGCVIVKDGKIIAEAFNEVATSNDPTAHAEVVAIRNACKAINNFQLTDCDVYTSCEPCPMCFGAIYWARPRRVIYANTKEDAAAIQFDDNFIYKEMAKSDENRSILFIHQPRQKAKEVFEEWKQKQNKIQY